MTCPLPTPELVASLANAYIEECARDPGSALNIDRAFAATIGGSSPWAGRGAVLCHAAGELARALGFPMPYTTQVTLTDGSTQPAERHTIGYFVDGGGFSDSDWATISALEPGDSYVIAGQAAVMTVSRVE
jgi:hypothetical protein